MFFSFFCLSRHGEACAVHRGGAADAGGEHSIAEKASEGNGAQGGAVPAAVRERVQSGDG